MKTLNRGDFLKCLGALSFSLLSSNSFSKNIVNEIIPSTPLRVAHLTDIHLEKTETSEKGFKNCLQTLNSLSQKPDFIINGGDAIMNTPLTFSKEKIKEQWNSFHQILDKNNTIPIYHCIGNHDLYGWPNSVSLEEESKNLAMNEYKLEKPYYSFNQGKWKFIILDSIRAKKSVPGYYAKLDKEQMIWLKEELENTSKDLFICIISHVPILAICTLFDGLMAKNKLTIPDNILHADTRELTALFYNYPTIKACLSGHIHMIDHVNYMGIDYFCNGAVSGAWWKGSHHKHPPSFSVMNFYDDGKVTRDINFYL